MKTTRMYSIDGYLHHVARFDNLEPESVDQNSETFAKLSGTAIMYLDSQSPKLHFDYRFPPTRE